MKAPDVCMLFVILLAIVSIKGIEGAYGSKRTKSISSNSNEEGELKLLEDFKDNDINKERHLDMKEFSDMLKETRFSRSAEEIFKALDADENSKISVEEIRRGYEIFIEED